MCVRACACRAHILPTLSATDERSESNKSAHTSSLLPRWRDPASAGPPSGSPALIASEAAVSRSACAVILGNVESDFGTVQPHWIARTPSTRAAPCSRPAPRPDQIVAAVAFGCLSQCIDNELRQHHRPVLIRLQSADDDLGAHLHGVAVRFDALAQEACTGCCRNPIDTRRPPSWPNSCVLS